MEAEILQRLHDSKICFHLEGSCDNGFYIFFPEMVIRVELETAKEIYPTLCKMACELYPESKFAKWWGEKNGK